MCFDAGTKDHIQLRYNCYNQVSNQLYNSYDFYEKQGYNLQTLIKLLLFWFMCFQGFDLWRFEGFG